MAGRLAGFRAVVTRGGKVVDVRERRRDPKQGVIERAPGGTWERLTPRWIEAEVKQALAAGNTDKVKSLLQAHPNHWLFEETYKAAPPALKRWITSRKKKGGEPVTTEGQDD